MVGNSPDGLAVADGNAWAANAGNGTISRIDEVSGRVLGTFSYASHSNPAAPIILWRGALWVGDSGASAVHEMDPATGKVIGGPIAVGGEPYAMTVTAGSVWVANYNDTVARISTRSVGGGSPQPTVSLIHNLPSGPKRMAEFESNLWVANQNDGTVTKINALSGQVVATIHVGGNPAAINAFQGSLWVVDRNRDTVTRFDLVSGKPIGSPIHVGSAPKRLTAGGDSIYVADSGDGTVTRIDASNGRVLGTIKVGGYPDAITSKGGVVWVALWSRPTIQHLGPPGGLKRIDESTGQLLGP